MRRAFMPRRKPSECPCCNRKGVSPNTNYDRNYASRDCRYCGAFTSKTYDPLAREWSDWSPWRELARHDA